MPLGVCLLQLPTVLCIDLVARCIFVGSTVGVLIVWCMFALPPCSWGLSIEVVLLLLCVAAVRVRLLQSSSDDSESSEEDSSACSDSSDCSDALSWELGAYGQASGPSVWS